MPGGQPTYGSIFLDHVDQAEVGKNRYRDLSQPVKGLRVSGRFRDRLAGAQQQLEALLGRLQLHHQFVSLNGLLQGVQDRSYGSADRRNELDQVGVGLASSSPHHLDGAQAVSAVADRERTRRRESVLEDRVAGEPRLGRQVGEPHWASAFHDEAGEPSDVVNGISALLFHVRPCRCFRPRPDSTTYQRAIRLEPPKSADVPVEPATE